MSSILLAAHVSVFGAGQKLLGAAFSSRGKDGGGCGASHGEDGGEGLHFWEWLKGRMKLE